MCSVAAARLSERNASVPEAEQMLVRIGINLGEVIVDGDDRHGEGVNIAARLQQLAEPGGICVSRKWPRRLRGSWHLPLSRWASRGSRTSPNQFRYIAYCLIQGRPTKPIMFAASRAPGGAFAIPGIGPVVGAGWLAATLLGAAAGGAAGGLIGSLTEAGIEEDDAHVYAEGVRRGGTLVTARVDDEHADAAAAILSQSGSIDITERRSEYETGGWSRYDPLAGPMRNDRLEADNLNIPPLPQV